MSALATGFVTSLLQHIFQNADVANLGDAAGVQNSAADGNLYYQLHTSDPGDGGSQNTSELSYTGYSRFAGSRTSATGFTVTGKNVSPTAEVTFGKRTDAGAAQVAMFWSVGLSAAGAGTLMLRGGIGLAPRPFVGTTNDNIACPGHGLAVDDRVVFWQYESIALPTGITEGTVYWVKTVPDADNVTVSATQGGATLDLTAVGQGTLQRITPITVTQNVTPKLETGTVLKFQ